MTDYNVLIDGRNFYDLINDQIKKYDEIRKISTGHEAGYTTGCLLGYQYFKIHYQLIAIDLSKQNALDAVSRAIQQIEFYGMLKTNCSFRKIKANSLRTLQRNSKSSVIVQMVEYSEVNVKLSDLQLNKLITATKNRQDLNLRMNTKIFNGNNLPIKL